MAGGFRSLLAPAAALWLGVACKRAPLEPPAAPAPDLSPPSPSPSLVITTLDTASTGYTNEMQAANLRRETAEMGIRHISKPDKGSETAQPRSGPPLPLSDVEKKERLEQLRDMTRQFTRMRRSIDGARDKSVALSGNTAVIIPGHVSGGALGVAEDGPGRWSGLYGGAVEPGERVIENAASWTELWGRLSREDAPTVDFAARRVAAVFLGSRPTGGYRARLDAIVDQKERLVVRWTEAIPAPRAALSAGETAPFLLVSLPKDARPVRFEKTR